MKSSFDVLVVSPDRSLLRRLSSFLEAFGYNVRQASDLTQAVASSQARRPDFLILDDALGDHRLEPGRIWEQQVHEGPHSFGLTLLLTDRHELTFLTQAIESGVEDFLKKPLDFGEVLARLRTGARSMEFERRAQRQTPGDAITGLGNLADLQDWFFREVARDNSGDKGLFSCVLTDLDYFQRINVLYGRPAGNAVLRAVAHRLDEMKPDRSACFHLGGGRFAVFLFNAGVGEAANWAEKARQALADWPCSVGSEEVRITASCGVVELVEDVENVKTLLVRADKALQQAKAAGRNFVACEGELDKETNVWDEPHSVGKLFANTTARELMTPCPVVLRGDDSIARGLAVLRQTCLEAVPIVDQRGKLIGVINGELSWPAGGSQNNDNSNKNGSCLLRDIMISDPPHRDESTSFAELLAYFTQHDETLVITRDNRPTGLMPPDNLANLTQPIDPQRLENTCDFSTSSDYLLVPMGSEFLE